MIEASRPLTFTKMQGAGNDFVLIDNRSRGLMKEDIAELAPDICDRKFGVGADGIMALFPPEQPQVDYTMFYLNPDGSDAGMCGNGGRCMALFAQALGFDSRQRFNVHDRIYEARVQEASVDLTFPMQATVQPLTLNDRQLYTTHTGTEHLVMPVDEQVLSDEQFLKEKGQELRHHMHFQPKGTNVNFIAGTAHNRLQLQTYERGVENLTLACGTGAIASAIVWHHMNLPNNVGDARFILKTRGGELTVHFRYDSEDNYHQIKLQGPAHFVFKGEFFR